MASDMQDVEESSEFLEGILDCKKLKDPETKVAKPAKPAIAMLSL